MTTDISVQMRDILGGAPRRVPQDVFNRHLLKGSKIQDNFHILQRPLPQDPKRESARAVDLVLSRDGRGQSASSVFRRLGPVHDGTGV